jgi:hypothetical protein
MDESRLDRVERLLAEAGEKHKEGMARLEKIEALFNRAASKYDAMAHRQIGIRNLYREGVRRMEEWASQRADRDEYLDSRMDALMDSQLRTEESLRQTQEGFRQLQDGFRQLQESHKQTEETLRRFSEDTGVALSGLAAAQKKTEELLQAFLNRQ